MIRPMRVKGRIAFVVAMVCLAGCHQSDGGSAGNEDAATGSISVHRFEFEGLPVRSYFVYKPSNLSASPPLVVYLHGCNQTAIEAAIQTRWNDFADWFGLVVAYPEQREPSADDIEGNVTDGNGARCWNWFHPEHISRGGGEAAAIAGITRQVMNDHRIDPMRVFLMGTSAGGSMTAVMGATYPELYAALAINAGAAYPLGLDASGALAAEAMGEHARRMPVIVFHGTADVVAPFVLGVAAVRQWLGANDFVDDGLPNQSVPPLPVSIEHHGFDESLVAGIGSIGDFCVNNRTAVPCLGGLLGLDDSYPHSIEHYLDAAGRPLIDFWIIHGGSHNYTSGDPTVSFSDPLGPDITGAAYEFFMFRNDI